MSTSTYNEPLLTCYAMRYPDLMAGYCFGVPSMCNFGALLSHWKEHGSQGAPPLAPLACPRAPPRRGHARLDQRLPLRLSRARATGRGANPRVHQRRHQMLRARQPGAAAELLQRQV